MDKIILFKSRTVEGAQQDANEWLVQNKSKMIKTSSVAVGIFWTVIMIQYLDR